MTLAEWKRKLHPGQRLACVYRWYWGKSADRPAPPTGREEITVREVKHTQMIYSTDKAPRVFMQYPKACDLKADDKGFELYFPKEPAVGQAGNLMSRYEWVSE